MAFGIVSLAFTVGAVALLAGLFVGDLARTMWLEDLLGPGSAAVSGSWLNPPLTASITAVLAVAAMAGAACLIASALKLRRQAGRGLSRGNVIASATLFGIGCLGLLFAPLAGVSLIAAGLLTASGVWGQGSSVSVVPSRLAV
ncbi:MAG: hypothetical protein LBO20_05715 [Bifidobacteriaceae bacterium]|nr:hypothetical protein [Bifidobacteriaceae bacterium]